MTDQQPDAEQRVREWLDTPAGYVLMPDHVAANVREVLRQLDEARATVADLRAENEQMFIDYSMQKSGRGLAEDAFNEVRAERDQLAARVREFEAEREPRCGATGPLSLCGSDGKPLGPCELPPGHRNAYHRDGRGWWLDDADTDEQQPAAGPHHADTNETEES